MTPHGEANYGSHSTHPKCSCCCHQHDTTWAGCTENNHTPIEILRTRVGLYASLPYNSLPHPEPKHEQRGRHTERCCDARISQRLICFAQRVVEFQFLSAFVGHRFSPQLNFQFGSSADPLSRGTNA